MAVLFTAFLVFLAAAAEAGIVTAYVLGYGPPRVASYNVPRQKTVTVTGVFEEFPVRCAEIVHVTIIESRQISELDTSPVAESEPFALVAFFAGHVPLVGKFLVPVSYTHLTLPTN